MFCKPLTKILYLMRLQFWFYLDLCKTKIFLSSSPHCDGNSYADKLKNPYMRKNQQKLKNQHAENRPQCSNTRNFRTQTSLFASAPMRYVMYWSHVFTRTPEGTPVKNFCQFIQGRCSKKKRKRGREENEEKKEKKTKKGN